jgi:hypothetical protein
MKYRLVWVELVIGWLLTMMGVSLIFLCWARLVLVWQFLIAAIGVEGNLMAL